jgi:hypothetical protein
MKLSRNTLRTMILQEMKRMTLKSKLREQRAPEYNPWDESTHVAPTRSRAGTAARSEFGTEVDVLEDERKAEIRVLFRGLSPGANDGDGPTQEEIERAEDIIQDYLLDAQQQGYDLDEESWLSNVVAAAGDVDLRILDDYQSATGEWHQQISFDNLPPNTEIKDLQHDLLIDLVSEELEDVHMGERVIKRNAEGPEVELIQTLLFSFLDAHMPEGGEGPGQYFGSAGIDGQFGGGTRRAVREAQRIAKEELGMENVQIDGDVGRQTLSFLIDVPVFEDPTPAAEREEEEEDSPLVAEEGECTDQYFKYVGEDGRTWWKVEYENGDTRYGEQSGQSVSRVQHPASTNVSQTDQGSPTLSGVEWTEVECSSQEVTGIDFSVLVTG